jgi:limonene-1,2-epoxide hydrolase
MPDGVVERYLESLIAHDWPAFAACLAETDFTRIGPYHDVYSSKSEYVAFISELMPRLAGYEMSVLRVTYAGHLAFAELSETVTLGDTAVRTPECVTFELTDDGLISRIEVFIQTMPPRNWRP